MPIVYLALGSNVGDRDRNLRTAIDELRNNGIEMTKMSSVIETEPVGGPPQNKFLNAVLKGSTDHSPKQLLKCLKAIEAKMGRKKTVRNGPRIMDIDILLYDNTSLSTPDLTIPHPRMFTRDFVMTPLKEIAPDLARDTCNGNR